MELNEFSSTDTAHKFDEQIEAAGDLAEKAGKSQYLYKHHADNTGFREGDGPEATRLYKQAEAKIKGIHLEMKRYGVVTNDVLDIMHRYLNARADYGYYAAGGSDMYSTPKDRNVNKDRASAAHRQIGKHRYNFQNLASHYLSVAPGPVAVATKKAGRRVSDLVKKATKTKTKKTTPKKRVRRKPGIKKVTTKPTIKKTTQKATPKTTVKKATKPTPKPTVKKATKPRPKVTPKPKTTVKKAVVKPTPKPRSKVVAKKPVPKPRAKPVVKVTPKRKAVAKKKAVAKMTRPATPVSKPQKKSLMKSITKTLKKLRFNSPSGQNYEIRLVVTPDGKVKALQTSPHITVPVRDYTLGEK